MELTIEESVLRNFGFSTQHTTLEQIGSGHINRTYLLTNALNGEKHILQNINTHVFKQPEVIASNIKHVANYLQNIDKTYLFPAPLPTPNGTTLIHQGGDYWRIIPFVEDTVALDTLSQPKQAYQAAKQFGKLSRLLDQFDSTKLSPTILGFHDLALRYKQFNDALNMAKPEFVANATQEIEQAQAHREILTQFEQVEHRADFPTRVMHHDTKISNVLLAEDNFDGICVIDLDTLMPGKFISDLGDMMRTYLCEFSENEKDLSKITIRHEYFAATIEGYLSEMGNMLSEIEKSLIIFSGKYIIYMQALRFLADYLNGSVYYPIHYPEQNLDRAKNQFKLLNELIKDEAQLQSIVDSCLAKAQH